MEPGTTQPSLAFVTSRLAGQRYQIDELERELHALTGAVPALKVRKLATGDRYVPPNVQKALEEGVVADYLQRIDAAEKRAQRLIGEAHRFYTLLAKPDDYNGLDAMGNSGPSNRLEGSITFEKCVLTRKLEGLTKEEFLNEWKYVTGALPHLIPETLLNQRIDETKFAKGERTARLNVETRLHNLCQRLDVARIGELAALTEEEILATKNVGRGTLYALKDYLGRHGLRLGMTFETAQWNVLC